MAREKELLLRFGNQRAPTISEHTTIEQALGYVWWGWWAKKWEHVPSEEEWAEIREAAKQKKNIGLFDRRALRFYTAELLDIRLTDGVARIPSPETQATPAYYASEYFPVWFKLSSLTEVRDETFREQFSFVPFAEDQTLYWGVEEAHTEWLKVCDTSSSRILHLSDIHFGADYSYSMINHGNRMLDDIIATYLRESNTEIGVIVISGDIITKGVERFFHDATEFLERLCSRIGLERQHVVVVPGNHDLWLEKDSKLTYPTTYGHEAGYREWQDSFFNESHAPIERLRVFRCEDGINLAFVQANSARLREPETMDFGYVGQHRYHHLLEAMKELDFPSLFRFFVMHHHVIPVPATENFQLGKPISVTVDSGQIIEDLQRYGVQCLLHGHQHVPFVGSVGRMSLDAYGAENGHREPIAVLGAGSAGASRLAPSFPSNSFSILTPVAEHQLELKVIEYTQGGPRRIVIDTTMVLPA